MYNKLGLLGYLFLIIGIILEIPNNIKDNNVKNLYYDIIQFIGYILIIYNLFYKKDHNKDHNTKDKKDHNTKDKKDHKEYDFGHVVLFIFYFYSLFLSGGKMYFVTFLTLVAHFILIKENNKIIILGYILSIIYYLMKLHYYINDIHHFNLVKISAYVLLSLFYISELLFN